MKRLLLLLAILPLTLSLASCNKPDDDGATASSGPLAKVAPPAGKAWADVVAQTPEGGYVMGNPKAPIKLIEYGSLTCPHCREFAEKSTTSLRDTFVASGRVSFEFRNFIRDALDLTAARIARCGTPDGFFPLTEQLYGYQTELFNKAKAAGNDAYTAAMNQPAEKRLVALANLSGLTEFAAARGIAKDQANACLADTNAAQALAKNTETQGDQFNIEGTPTFLINGSKVDARGWEEVKARLENLGAR